MGDDIGRNTAFYYNINTHAVEQEGQSKAKDLLGPFPTREAAAGALETIRQREQVMSEQDREWRGDPER